MQMNAALTYQNNKISTATPAELTLMLYEGAIKFCNIAVKAVEDKQLKKAGLNIIKTEKIISYLWSTLDNNYPVAKEFERIYDYLYSRLVYANIKKDLDVLQEVLGHLRGLRDTWKEVMKLAR